MRIGCSPAYTFAHFGSGLTFDQLVWAVRRTAELGFCGLQLETYRPEQIAFYTSQNIAILRGLFDSLGLECSEFVAHSARADLTGLDPARRRLGLEHFRRIVGVCTDLGIVKLINLPSAAPPELITTSREIYPGGLESELELPASVTWAQVWSEHLETIRLCLDALKGSGIRLIIEGVPYGVISNTDSFLRLASELGAGAGIGFNLDTGHTFVQKESLPVAVEKLGSFLLGTHISDNDGCVDDHWIPGRGRISWAALVSSMRKVGYAGPLDIEINVASDPDAAYLEAKRFLEEIVG